MATTRAKRARIKKATFRYIESEIAHYHETLKEIECIKMMMYEEGEGRSYSVDGRRSNMIGDPTFKKAAKVVMNRQIQHLEKVVNAIGEVYGALPEEKKRLVELLYWNKPQKYTWDGIAEQFHYSKKTLQRWRNAIVEEIAERLGMN